jgi:LAO/AO transport system kinase
MLRMGPKSAWTPPIVKTSAVTGEGIDELWDAIEQHRKHGEQEGELQERRRRRVIEEVKNMVAFRLGERAASTLREGADGLAADLSARRVDPYRAAEILLEGVVHGED